MNINSPQELYGFLIGNALVGICPESQNLILCIDSLSRMCPCDPSEFKTAKYNHCIALYVNFVHRSQSLSGMLFQKVKDNRIQFFLNGQLIGQSSR